jgi:hypothetical protein
MSLLIAGAAISAVGAVSGYLGAGKAADAAKKAGRIQAKAIVAEGVESKRRQIRENKYRTGFAKAATYASNLQMSGSSLGYIGDMEVENVRELDWMDREIKARAHAAKSGANSAAANLKRSATTSLLSGVGSIAMGLG